MAGDVVVEATSYGIKNATGIRDRGYARHRRRDPGSNACQHHDTADERPCFRLTWKLKGRGCPVVGHQQ